LEEEVNMGKFDENEEQIIEQIQNERMTAQKFFDLATGKIRCGMLEILRMFCRKEDEW